MVVGNATAAAAQVKRNDHQALCLRSRNFHDRHCRIPSGKDASISIEGPAMKGTER
jgi:hypothetical protein